MLVTVIWVLSILGVVLVGYLLLTIWDARHQVSMQPRTEMFVCDTHGSMPVSATLVLFEGTLEVIKPDGRTVKEPIRACPICFKRSIEIAKGSK
jgi:hypothetical protein